MVQFRQFTPKSELSAIVIDLTLRFCLKWVSYASQLCKAITGRGEKKNNTN